MADVPNELPTPTASSDVDLDAAHQLLYQAYTTRKLHIGMKGALNSRRSPVHNIWQNVIPYALILFMVVNYSYEMGIKGFILSSSLGLGVGLFVIPRWIMNKVRRRTVILAFGSAAGWDSLWEVGGLSMRLDEDPTVICDSPGGDWKAFAFQNFGNKAA